MPISGLCRADACSLQGRSDARSRRRLRAGAWITVLRFALDL